MRESRNLKIIDNWCDRNVFRTNNNFHELNVTEYALKIFTKKSGKCRLQHPYRIPSPMYMHKIVMQLVYNLCLHVSRKSRTSIEKVAEKTWP